MLQHLKLEPFRTIKPELKEVRQYQKLVVDIRNGLEEEDTVDLLNPFAKMSLG